MRVGNYLGHYLNIIIRSAPCLCLVINVVSGPWYIQNTLLSLVSSDECSTCILRQTCIYLMMGKILIRSYHNSLIMCSKMLVPCLTL